MSHFLTLIKTEYLKRKPAYWTPVLIVGIITVVLLVVSLTALIANWDVIQYGFINMSFDFDDIQDGVKLGVYGSMMLVVFV
ncbi:MAG: hypothetical protein K9N05_06180, partial [Candidatus Marinimicrobia bacterium]|nr:hypothetical protein [Candidatus Neomarinimicrobiota bacterium]